MRRSWMPAREIARFAMFRSTAGIMSIVAALVFCNATRAAASNESLYQFAPVPQWVTSVTPEYAAPLPADGVSDGTWDLLLDWQINVTADGGDDYYQHTATKVVS